MKGIVLKGTLPNHRVPNQQLTIWQVASVASSQAKVGSTATWSGGRSSNQSEAPMDRWTPPPPEAEALELDFGDC